MHIVVLFVVACVLGFAMSLSVSLTSTRHGSNKKNGATLVFLHGLDSSGKTWEGVIPCFVHIAPCVNMDLRGCGTSPMGNVDDFSMDALVQDVARVLEKHKIKDQVILVGHSMGGRIAMAYAAAFPQQVAALVIEDMDIARRPVESSPIPIPTTRRELFERKFQSKQDVMDAFANAGYPPERVSSWVDEGRIYPLKNNNSNEWWSDVNPDFRALCYQRILDTHLSQETWHDQLVGQNFCVHVLVADDTICKPASLQEMQSSMKRMVLHDSYPVGTTHSIHSSAQDEFLATLKAIVEEATISEKKGWTVRYREHNKGFYD